MKKTYKLTNRKWWLISLSFIICHLSFSPLGAQTFTQRIQQKDSAKEGTLNVTHSKEIDELVNGKQPTTTITTPLPTTENKDAAKDTAEPHTSLEVKEKAIETAPKREESSSENTVIDTRKKVMRNSYKVTGYRVQVFSGGNTRNDRIQAEHTRDRMKAAFPDEPIYTHFYSPRWICRMGNYRTYDEANKILKKVKALGYSQACIVKGKINIQY